jgi:hypothetical protein
MFELGPPCVSVGGLKIGLWISSLLKLECGKFWLKGKFFFWEGEGGEALKGEGEGEGESS